MMLSRPVGLVLAFLLSLAEASTVRSAETTAPATLTLDLACPRCDGQGPTLSLLWRSEATAAPTVLRTITASDWASGQFVLSREEGDVTLAGVAIEGGWSLAVPVDERGLPFRVVAARSGFVAERAAFWPEQDGAALRVSLNPLADVLDAHPAWDPARTTECEMLVPKAAELPLVFLEHGQPRAWLFPTPGSEDPSRWTFQFVRPGASLLERVSVEVAAFDEGDSWAVRAPLAAVTTQAPAAGKTAPAEGSARLAGETDAAAAAAAPARPMTIAGIGALSLADCPRLAR